MTDFIKEQLQLAMLKDGLSEQEINVLWYMIEGVSNQKIAERLMISVRTVEQHQKSIYEKMDLAGKRELPKWIVESISNTSSSHLFSTSLSNSYSYPSISHI